MMLKVSFSPDLMIAALHSCKKKTPEKNQTKNSSSSSNVGSKSYACALVCYLMTSETRQLRAKPNSQVYTVAKTLLFHAGVDKS